MKRHKSIGPMLRNGELKFWTPVNFEVEYFLNEETEGVLTDTVIYFSDQHLTWLSQFKPNARWVSPFNGNVNDSFIRLRFRVKRSPPIISLIWTLC